MKRKFYTYAYLREDGTPYYIGKGIGPRCYRNYGRPCNIPSDKDRILKLKINLTEEEAFKHEMYMISVFGRKVDGGLLRNNTLGGEGVSGRIVSERERESHSLHMKERWMKDRDKMVESLYKRPPRLQSQQEIESRRIYMKENNPTSNPKVREKISKSRKGRVNYTKPVIIITPDGKTIEVDNLAQYCRENNLSRGGMCMNVKYGKTYKGYKCFYK